MFDNTGLNNSAQDLTLTALFFNKFGTPVARTLRATDGLAYTERGPHLFHYDEAAGTWSPTTIPGNEESHWNGGPQMVVDDNGDLLACGEDLVLQSTDGTTWTTRTDLRHFIMAPAPYTNLGSAAGKPAWMETPVYATNVPVPNSDTFQWVTSMARMPWGEIFAGGESSCYVHSLDNGHTWEWFDPVMSVPQRDMQGIPMYPNPAHYRINKPFDAIATKDGEVMFNCQRNDGHHFFIRTAAGNVMEAAQGLPSGTIYPEVCTQFASVPGSGEIFMSVEWSNYAGLKDKSVEPNPPSPTHNAYDVYKWDGTSWTTITTNHNTAGWYVTVPNSLVSDGYHVYTPTIANGSATLRMWSPDLSGGAPPRVSITGGTSATAGPTTTMDATTARASLQMDASVSSDHPAIMQWTARGPAPVVFDDPASTTPVAWFSAPGNYVLNLRATDTVNHLRAGTCVIVHVLPAANGSAPVITIQPQNQIGVTGGTGSATFSLQASGTGPLHYQWKRNAVDITNNASAQTSTLTVSTKLSDNGAAFHCVVTNANGTVVSNCAMLGIPPAIIASPVSQVVSSGGYAVFSVACTGTQPFQWQWMRNNVPITNGDDKTHRSGSFATNIPGSYSVTVSNLFGSTTSSTAALSVGTPPAKFFLVMNAVASPSSSGGDAVAEDSTYVSASYPINTAIPFGADNAPLNGFNTVFEKWTVTSGGTITNAFQPQSTVKGATAGSTVVVTTNYKDPAALPLYFLNVVGGLGTGVGRASALSSSSTPVTMNIAAAAPPPGYLFNQWTGATVANPGSAQTTITLTNPNAETTVAATYVIAPFTLWKQQRLGAGASNPAIADDAADPDHDGVPNLVEYAINTDPLDRTSGPPSITVDTEMINSARYLRLTVPRNPLATDVTLTVQVSSDLVTWDSVSTVVEARNGTQLQVRDTLSYTSTSRRFIRLQITRP